MKPRVYTSLHQITLTKQILIRRNNMNKFLGGFIDEMKGIDFESASHADISSFIDKEGTRIGLNKIEIAFVIDKVL